MLLESVKFIALFFVYKFFYKIGLEKMNFFSIKFFSTRLLKTNCSFLSHKLKVKLYEYKKIIKLLFLIISNSHSLIINLALTT